MILLRRRGRSVPTVAGGLMVITDLINSRLGRILLGK